jgi:hypothetical protein
MCRLEVVIAAAAATQSARQRNTAQAETKATWALGVAGLMFQ